MELIGIVGLLAWLALAGVCFWKRRGLWVLGAVLVPVAVFGVGLLMLRFVVPFEGDGGLGDVGMAVGVAFGVILIAFLSSFLILVLGAILPRAKTTPAKTAERVHYHTRWQGSTVASDRGGWNRGPDFYNLDAAHRWAEGSAELQGVSVVEIYTKEPTSVNVVETVGAP